MPRFIITVDVKPRSQKTTWFICKLDESGSETAVPLYRTWAVASYYEEACTRVRELNAAAQGGD